MRRMSVLLALLVVLAGCGSNSNTTSSSSAVSMASVASELAARRPTLRAATTTPTYDQQMAAIRLFIGVFNNLAPGADLLNQATMVLNSGMSADTLADVLTSLPIFTNSFYSDKLSNADFSTQFMNNLVGSTVSSANKAAMAEQIALILNAGWTRGHIMYFLATALATVPTSDPNWGQAAAQLNNRMAVAYYQAVTKGVAAADLTMLQNVTYDSMTMTMAENSLMNSIMMGGSTAIRLMVANSGVAQDSAFSGTYGLMGIEAYGGSPTAVGAQLVDTYGSPVGSFIPAGRTGIATSVAFDGTNFLLIWEDDNNGLSNGSTGWQIYGQFINTSGQKVGQPFPISSTGVWFDGSKTMVYANGRYLVTYTKLINPALGDSSQNRYVAGQFIASDGSKLGSEFRISSGYGARESVWTNGSNFIVAWGEDQYDTEVRARIIGGDGTLGTEFSINASPEKSDNPISIGFDGTNYLVVWCDQLASGNWQVYGQKVSTTGTLVGSAIPIAVDSTKNQIATTVSCNPNNNCLVGFVDMSNMSNWMLYGQYLNLDGTLSGSRFVVDTDTTMQMGGLRYENGHYWATFSSGTYYIPSVSAMGSNGGIFVKMIQ